MGDEHIIRVLCEADVVLAQSRTRRLALSLGFPSVASWELAVVASELATNQLKYAGRGVLHLRICADDGGEWLEIEALDEGPGFDDPQLALVDGVSEGQVRAEALRPTDLRGLGLGLGAVVRLTDVLELGNRPDGGAFVRARRRLPG